MPTPPDVTINVPLPADLHRQVKIACAMQDVTLKAAVIAALEAWATDNIPAPSQPIANKATR